MLRTNPKDFIPFMEHMISTFDGTDKVSVENIGMGTFEGVTPYQELVEYLKTVEPSRPLIWNPALAKASLNHATT